MRSSTHIRQTIAIWLAAILLVLSVAASAHSQHLDDGVQNHCALCFHQHQLHHTITTTEFVFALTLQTFERQQYVLPILLNVFKAYYHSRAPPVSR